MDILKQIVEITERNADKTFLIDLSSQQEITYKEFFELAADLAIELNNINILSNSRIALILPNSLQFAALYFACLYSGIIVVPLSSTLGHKELSFIILNSGVRTVVFSQKTMDIAKNLMPKASGIKFLFLDMNDEKDEKNIMPSPIERIHMQFPKPTKIKEWIPFKDISSANICSIHFTSGTTSLPKGVVHGIDSLFQNADAFNKQFDVTSEDRYLHILPMSYMAGFLNSIISPFMAGASIVLAPQFDAKSALRFWEFIQKFNANSLWLTPTILSSIRTLDRGTDGRKYCPKHMKNIFVGTAPLPSRVKWEFEQYYQKEVFESYGLTELLFISSNSHYYPRKEGSAGRLLQEIDVEIRDKDGAIVKEGEEGEIFVRSPFMMEGYLNYSTLEPEKTDASQYFPTGDIGYLDQDRNIYITGRKKDLIIRGGFNISPRAIEDVIHTHPAVEDVAVIGIPNQFYGEEIMAVMKFKPGFSLSLEQNSIEVLCKRELQSNAVPIKYFVIEQFPTSTTGKIQKAQLRAWIKEELEKNGKKQDVGKEFRHPTREIDDSSFFRPSNIVKNSIQAMSIMYNNMVYEMQREGIDVTVLSLGEAFFNIPLFSFNDLPSSKIYHYSHSRGIIELRECISKYFLNQYDISFSPEREIIVTAGSKIAIHMGLMAVLNSGDEVIIHEPAWVSYPEQVKLCYGVPVQVPFYEEVFDFEKYITNRTKVIIINSPNNPRGKVFSLEELSYLYQLAKKYKLFILSDEAYSDFLLEEEKFISMANLDREKRHTLICNSISKNYGISGWRLGYVITNAELTNQILKINQHLVTCPATILEYYIAKHFFEIIKITKPQIRAVVIQRQEIAKFMDKIGLKYLPGTATFYFFVSIEGSSLSSMDFCTKLLKEEHICVVPGIGYGPSCNKYVRVSVGTEPLERIQHGLLKLKELIDKH
jgi:aspartate aminotransferase/aminotransferase